MCTTMAHDVCNENHECTIRGTQRGERDIYHNKLVTKHKYYSFNKKNYKAKIVLEYKYRFTRVYNYRPYFCHWELSHKSNLQYVSST